MKTKLLVATASILLLGALAGAATTGARGKGVKTIISVERPVKLSKHKILVSGTITSKKPVCRRGRKVDFNGDGNFPDDVDRTSRGGAFAGVIFVGPNQPWGLDVKRAVLGGSNHTVCGRATYLNP